MKIINDRMTVVRARGLVVFLIGMRINRWWKIHRWLPVALAMPRMLRELRSRTDSGFLGGITLPGMSIQYWESTDALMAYASDRSGKHFPAWADFYKRVGTSGDVGSGTRPTPSPRAPSKRFTCRRRRPDSGAFASSFLLAAISPARARAWAERLPKSRRRPLRAARRTCRLHETSRAVWRAVA